MRTISIGIVILLAASSTYGQESHWALNFSGYSQETYTESNDTFNNDRTRLRVVTKHQHRLCGSSSTELEIGSAEDSFDELADSNWVQWAYLVCGRGKTKVTVGRLFLRSGYATYWPGGIITARYPGSYPFNGYFGYGVDVARSVGDHWNVAASVTGRSDRQFDAGGQFDRVEVASRALRSFGDRGHYSLVAQVSEDFTIGGIDFKFGSDRFNYSGGVFYSDKDDSPFSLLLQAEWTPREWFAVHGQIDERVDDSLVLTAGLGFRWRGFYLVTDYEYDLDRDGGDALVSMRYNW